MNIKAIWDKADSLRGCLSHLRTKMGRRRYAEDEDPLPLENPFVSDEAKILSSKTRRTMARKTQVFTRPENSLVRTRDSHVGEVVAISVVASEMLGLNTDLVRAAAWGHDIGHVPFGHQGESWMAKAMGQPEFCHEAMGVIVAQKIERRGRGLNLCHETLECMYRHSGNTAKDGMPAEAWILRYMDKAGYLFADINDIGGRMRYPLPAELVTLVNEFGGDQRERTTTAIAGMVIESAELGKVCFEQSELGRKFSRIRDLMLEIYPHVTQQNVTVTMESILELLRLLNLGDPFLLLALMNDSDAIMLASESMKDMRLFNRTAVSEVVPYLQEIGPVDLCDPDLDW